MGRGVLLSLDTNYEKMNAAFRHTGFYSAELWEMSYGGEFRNMFSGGLSWDRNQGCPEMMDRTVGDALNVYRLSGIAHLSISQEKMLNEKEATIRNDSLSAAACHLGVSTNSGVVTPDCSGRSRTRTVAFFGPAIVGVMNKERYT